MRTSKPRIRFSFRYISENLYEILDNGAVTLCIRAHGLSAFVVEKHRTAMVSKRTTMFDRFDKVETDVEGSGHCEVFWFVKSGPKVDEASIDLSKLLDQIVEHHVSYIAKIIVE